MASFTFNTTRQPKDGKRERLTVADTAVGITASVYTVAQAAVGATKYDLGAKEASAAVLQVIDQPINWTVDGTTPTADIGFNSIAGDFIYLDSAQKVKEFRAIRSTGSSAEVEVVALFGV